MARHATAANGGKATAHASVENGVVQEYFDTFARALTAGDGRAIAKMWAVPAFVIGDTMVMAVNSDKEVEQFFAGAKEQYNEKGITDTRAEIFGLEWVTERIVVVDVRWPYLDEHGMEKGAEVSTYTLRRDDEGELKLHVALMRGEATE